MKAHQNCLHRTVTAINGLAKDMCRGLLRPDILTSPSEEHVALFFLLVEHLEVLVDDRHCQ